MLSLAITFLFVLIGIRIFVGKLQLSDVVPTIFILLPFLVIFFSILYLLSAHLITKFRNHYLIRPYLKSENHKVELPDNVYMLPMPYRYLGILLIVSPVLLYIIDNPLLALILVIFLGAYYLKTPYKITVENDTFTIFMLYGKQQVRIDDVRAVKMGVFHNRVDCEDKYYYLSHFLTNISSLTGKFAQKTGTQAFDQEKWDAIEKETDSPGRWAYRTILMILIAILSSAFGVVYFMGIVKQIH